LRKFPWVHDPIPYRNETELIGKLQEKIDTIPSQTAWSIAEKS